MNYTYLYDFNQKRYQKLGEQTLLCKETLSFEVIKYGYLLPKRLARGFLFGNGGVLDAHKQYVESSQMNAYAKYAKVLDESDEKEIYLGGAYEFDEKLVPYFDEEIIYLGYLSNHWGHFITDSTTRLYTFLENTNRSKKFAFLMDEGSSGKMMHKVERFLELLGIRKQIIFITQVTRFKSIIIPEQAYMSNYYYSKPFLDVFHKVASSVNCSNYPPYKNVYFARAYFPKAMESEFGEEIFLNLFSKNHFEIIAPENCTLDEQIALIRNATCIAGIVGTVTHNLLFAQPEKKIIMINKTHNFNTIQMNINQMCNGNAVYIDAYLAKYGVSIGNGPFLLCYSEPLERFIQDNNMISVDEKYKSTLLLKQNSEKYEKTYFLKNGKSMNSSFVKNKNMYNYFSPKHLLQYNQKVYPMEFM